MILQYETLLSSDPIELTIGTIRQPKLREIRALGFGKYNFYKMFLKMTPELYYTMIAKNKKSEWESLSDEEKESITIFDIAVSDETAQKIYLEIFDYFFIEKVIYYSGVYIILKREIEDETQITEEDVNGVIYKNNFTQLLEILQQVCAIYEKEEHIENFVYKNERARQIHEKILKAEREKKQAEESEEKANPDYSIPNIISAVSNIHPCLTPITIWDLTVFQLIDSFNRLRMIQSYKINSTSVSVWGDEKEHFKPNSWFRNEYERP